MQRFVFPTFPLAPCLKFFPCFSGKIVFYTHPPEQHDLPAHLSAEIVQRWGTEFDLVGTESAVWELDNHANVTFVIV